MIPLRPSASSIWTRCAAAPLFTQNAPPQPESDAAREGTCAAWVAESVLTGGKLLDRAALMIGTSHENGWQVTPDMAHHVQGYVDLVRLRGGEVTAERFVRLNEFIAGTLDSSVDATAENGRLFVDDLKYGHKVVEVFENPQVIIYGEAEARRLEALGVVINDVQLGIYQPRAWHPEGYYRRWILTRAELASWAAWIVERGTLCQAPVPVAEPGDQCRYCDAVSVCAAAAMTLQRGFEIVRDSRYRVPTGDEMSAELDFLDLLSSVLQGRANALRAEAEARIRKGEFVRNWYMRPRKGNRVFKVHPVVVHALTGVDPRNTEATVTPAELERRGANVDIVASLTFQPDIPPQLAKLSEKAVRKAFAT